MTNPNPSPTGKRFGLVLFGGGGWIRTTEGIASRFTVCPLWPLGNSSVCNFGAGGRIRTPDLLITNRFRFKNPGISKAFCPFSLRNQQLVPAIHSTVSTHKFRPVGQLVGQPAFRAESGLDDSDNSSKEVRKRRFDGCIVTLKGRKVKPSIFGRL